MAEAFAGMKDILLGYDTDIYFENNDLMICTGVDYIEREIYKLLITEPGDWKANFHFSPVGNPPPPRPLRPDFRTSSMTSSLVIAVRDLARAK